MRKAFLFILLLSFSYASLVWEYTTGGPVSLKPVTYSSMIVAASDDGKIYALDPTTGLKKWQTTLGGEPTDILVFGNTVVVSTTTAKIVKISNAGTILTTVDLAAQNATRIYGMSANQKEIFVTASNGVYRIDQSFNLKKLQDFTETIVGLPAAGIDYVIYGKGNQLTKLTENGVVSWSIEIEDGSFWTSRPIIDNGVVYVGALDNRMHAYVVNNGLEIWSSLIGNWIMGSPYLENGMLYFGATDGNVYAMSTGSGNVNWEAETQLAVETTPESGTMGGMEVVFIGSSDKGIYAITKNDGEIIWKTIIGGAVGNPLFYYDKIIFGAYDGTISAYNTERACSITNPLEGDMVGLKELSVSGGYVAGTNPRVMISINNGQWKDTQIEDDGWVYYLNPKEELNVGLNTISCMVVDAYGQESGERYTTIAMNHDPTIALSDFIVTISQNIVEGSEFTIFVNDGEDGTPVDRVNITINGESQIVDKTLNVTIPTAGEYSLIVHKIGFNDANRKVYVNTQGVSPLVLVIAGVIIVFLLWQIWKRIGNGKRR